MIYLLFVAALMPAVIIALYARITSPAEGSGGRGVLLRGLLAGVLAGAVAAILENLLGAGVELVPTQGLATYLLRYMVAMSLVQAALTLVAVMYANKASTPEARDVFSYVLSAAVASIGLVLLEYALYLTDIGLESTLYLMLLSLPGHCAYGVVLGTYFGLAQTARAEGNARTATLHLVRAFAFPLIGFAVYDAAVFSQKADVIVIALVVEIVIMLLSIADLHSASRRKQAEAPVEEEHHQEGERGRFEAIRNEAQPQNEEAPSDEKQPHSKRRHRSKERRRASQEPPHTEEPATSPSQAAREAAPTSPSSAAREAAPTSSSRAAREAAPTSSSRAAREAAPTSSSRAAREAAPTSSSRAKREAAPTSSSRAKREARSRGIPAKRTSRNTQPTGTNAQEPASRRTARENAHPETPVKAQPATPQQQPSHNPADRGNLAVPDIQPQVKEPVVPWWQVVAQAAQPQPPQPVAHQIPRRSELKDQEPQPPQNPRDMTPQQQQDYLRRQRMRQQQIYEQQQRAREQ